MDNKATIAVDNYINGNRSDFITQVRSMHKRTLMLVIVHLAEHLAATKDYQYRTYSDNGYHDAVVIVNDCL